MKGWSEGERDGLQAVRYMNRQTVRHNQFMQIGEYFDRKDMVRNRGLWNDWFCET
jgi:hypothetical protein